MSSKRNTPTVHQSMATLEVFSERFPCVVFSPVFWEKKGGCLGWALFCGMLHNQGPNDVLYVLGCNTKVPKTFNFNVVRLMDKNHAPPGCIHETSWDMRQFLNVGKIYYIHTTSILSISSIAMFWLASAFTCDIQWWSVVTRIYSYYQFIS